jgi:hypothetical protein
MTNGIELLHKRHDTELELMENLRVIVHKRARAEQHYAQELIKIQQTAKKAPLKGSLEDASLKTTYDAWNCLVDGMEAMNAKLNLNAAHMSNVLLKRIDQLIKDKRSARKAFDATRLRIEQENHSSALDVQKTRRKYQESKHAAEDAKQKYEQSKPKQMESNKKAYHKKAEQLFCAHNDYILAIGNANTHEEAAKLTLFPLCLNTFQERMEIMLNEWKRLLETFHSCLNMSQDMTKNFNPISELLLDVHPLEEYQQFIINQKSNRDPSPVEIHEFDPAIMEHCRIPLGTPGQVVVNDVSMGDLQKKLDKAQKTRDDLERTISEKTSEYESACVEMEVDPNSFGPDGRPRHVVASFLKEQIEDLTSKKARQQCICDIIKGALDGVGDNVPGAFVEGQQPSITDQPPPPLPVSPSHEYDESTGSTNASKRAGTFGKSFGKLVSRKKASSEPSSQKHVPSDYHDPEELDRPPPLPPSRGANGGYKSTDDSTPLEEELWYYGEVNRKDAEQLLRKDGDYLIRLSKEKGPVLTMKWQGIAKHFVVQYTEEVRLCNTYAMKPL